MKHQKNNCKHSFIISIMGKIYKDNFDQNGPYLTLLVLILVGSRGISHGEPKQ